MFVTLRPPGQTEGDTEAEQGSFAGRNQGGRHRTIVALANEPAERSQGRLGSCRCLRDEVNRASDQRPSGKRQAERRHRAGSGGHACGIKSPAPAWRRETAFGMRRCQAVAEPRRATNREPFEAAANIDVHPDERGQAPSPEPLRDRASEATTQRRATDQCDGAPGPRNRFSH